MYENSFSEYQINGMSPSNMFNSDINEVAPSIYLGSYNLFNNPELFSSKNFKIIINCSPTYRFLNILEESRAAISSNVIILSLDLSFSINKFNEDEKGLLTHYVDKFNRILQNYFNFFFKYNPNGNNMVHKMPDNKEFNLNSPILTGNLKHHLFNINRLIKLIKNIDDSVDVLILSADGNSQISTALAMSYLMDSYNYDLNTSFNNILAKRSSIRNLNPNYYDDLLVIESLKKFYLENIALKNQTPDFMMRNCKLKRRNDEEVNDQFTPSFISCGGGERKRRIKYYSGM